MNIPDPVGLPGDVVLVRNYRASGAWERAQLLDATYTPPYQAPLAAGGTYPAGGYWRYDAWIDRPFKKGRYGRQMGGGYRIQVSGEDARPLS